MNKKLYIFAAIIIVAIFSVTAIQNNENDADKRQREYAAYIENHPYSKRKALSKKELKAMPKKDRPDLAFEQDFLRTMDPKTKSIPRKRFFEALDYVKRYNKNKPKGQRKEGEDFSWVSRGPNNVAGRTRALMFDPNDPTDKKVFAGGVGGGIWVNNDITDENVSWSQLAADMSNFAVTAMDYDPVVTTTMYAGTGEGYGNIDAINGGGIWKSTDGGATWVNLPSSRIYDQVFDIIVRNEGGVIGVIYAAVRDLEGTTGSDLIRSLDGGETWDIVSDEIVRDLELASDNTIWFGTATGSIFSSSTGTKFTANYTSSVENPRRVDLAVAQSNPSVVYALIANGNALGEIVKTTDGGTSWTTTATTPSDSRDSTVPNDDFTRGQAWYDLIVQISPVNENHIYVGGINTFNSLDGGDSWTKITSWSDFYDATVSYAHADQHNIIFRPNHPNELLVANDGGIQYAPDLTKVPTTLTFDPYNEGFFTRNKNFNITQFYSGAIDPVNPNGFLGGSQDNGSQFLETPGIASSEEVWGGDGGFCFIDQTATNETRGVYQIVSFTNNNYYLLDYTGGSSVWISLINNPNNGSFINAADYDSENNVLYSYNDNNEITTATLNADFADQGSFSDFKGVKDTITIPELLNSTVTNIRVSPYNKENRAVYFSTSGGRIVKRTADENVAVRTNFAVFEGSISCLEIGATEDELLLTYSNYGVESVWYSTNGGLSWINVEGNLPDMPVRWSLFNPLNRKQVILATEAGIWKTDDITATTVVWEPASTGMGSVRVDMLQYRASDNTVLAATHGRGMFTTTFTDGTASVDDVLTDKKAFTVYPTISNGNFTIFAKNSLGKSKINIFDISGRQVYKANLDFTSEEKQEISVNLNAGIYIVNVVDENNKKSSNKIIIE
ncbi:T9SS type A sorting domain-containing protein [Polaribacter aestuariivivens]|uniref:T9SS type A sorting domain-containing protein n=1 Tax=Polaribacter aestuariivivens TaxID=2304626 RepID=A0A5S3N590_9FLAO|nr:T9SS type A sorting domain-containing protein [Polaribacter aestuariivivens]TMM30528.1 T9SS type A sorting domain-containing protein [Polaribacter aestuariivivens]